MKSKIATIEDVTKIVGISNYIKALNLDKKLLKLEKYELLTNRVNVYFKYEENLMKITINKKYSMIAMECGCNPGLEYCPHIALAVMYLVEHEEFVNQIVNELNQEYDPEFNQLLFSDFSNKELRTLPQLEITLKQIDYRKPDAYELQVKIGNHTKYVLKKQLDQFLDVYDKQEGEVIFGQNFVYDPNIHDFSMVDKQIIDFIHIYRDSQTQRNFDGSIVLQNIQLEKKALLQFLKLLEHKNFNIEIGYYVESFSGIQEEFPLNMKLEQIGSDLKWSLEKKKIQPFISSYEYVIVEGGMYHVKECALLKLLNTNHKENIYFKKEEWKDFSRKLLPKIQNHNLQLDQKCKDIFKNELPTVKYYFEKDRDTIIASIHLSYQEYEIDIHSSENQFGEIFIIRDSKQENQWIEQLIKLGFEKNQDKWILEREEEVIAFLRQGLTELCECYDVYVAKELKEIRIWNHTNITSTFSIGRDQILRYEFQIDQIPKEELSDLLESLKFKKKYYKLKNGNYFNLETEEMQEFYQLTNQLGIDSKQNNQGLSKYKVLALQDYQDSNFVHLSTEVKMILERFKNYQDIPLDLPYPDFEILRDYQVTGVKWMNMLSTCGFGGILADEMGLGKSLQTIEYIKLKYKEKMGLFLLVVPTSLIYNWENELKHFAPDLPYTIINDTPSKRTQKLKNLRTGVVLTSYGLLRQDIEYYLAYQFDTCILDEAQNIKNVNTETTKMVKQIQAETKFALTGTPIENSVLEIWSIFDYIMPGFFPNLKEFKQRYQVTNLEENEPLYELNHRISPFILRRKKKDVLKELPDKIETNLLIDLTESQKKFYLATLEETKRKIDEIQKNKELEKSQILILSLLTKLRQICIDPRLLVEDTTIGNGKLEALMNLVKEAIENGHKILLFSQFPSALKLIRQELEENRITCYYLDGSTKSKTRMELVDAFNQDRTNIFLISLKAGGTGLNLTSADLVIHLDPWWNPQVENQATDRSHRIGQKKVVEVIKLIAKGTIEEKIIALQEKKKSLSDQIIEGDNRSEIVLSKLTEDELKELLKY